MEKSIEDKNKDMFNASGEDSVDSKRINIKKGDGLASPVPLSNNTLEEDLKIHESSEIMHFTTREIEILEVLNLAATIHENVNSAAIENPNNVILLSRLLCSPLLATSRRSVIRKRKTRASASG